MQAFSSEYLNGSDYASPLGTMSCCFGPPRAKYDAGSGGDTHNKDRKNRKNKEKRKTAAKNGVAGVEPTKSADTIDAAKQGSSDVSARTADVTPQQIEKEDSPKLANNDEPIRDDESDKVESIETNELAIKAETEISENNNVDDEDKNKIVIQIDDPADVTQKDRASAEVTATDVTQDTTDAPPDVTPDTIASTDDTVDAKEATMTKTSDEPSPKDKVPMRQVFVISRDKTTSFYGSVYKRKQEEAERLAQEKQRAEEEEKAREERRRQKLAALKAAVSARANVLLMSSPNNICRRASM